MECRIDENLVHLFDQKALQLSEKEAIIFLRKGKVESRATFRSLREASNRAANALREMGLKKGERVVLFMPKSMELVIFHLAVLKTGAISVILNPGFKKDEMTYFLKDTAAAVVIVGKQQEVLIRAIDARRNILSIDTERQFSEKAFFQENSNGAIDVDTNGDDPAILIYTSGTTGQPKGAILTQKNLVQDGKNIVNAWEISERDVLCHALPLFHIHGLCFALHTSLIAGAKIVMCDEFSSETVVDILARKQGDLACTIFMAVPTIYMKLIGTIDGKELDFSHLRFLASGSAALLSQDFDRIRKYFGKEPLEREGMSETGVNFSNPLRGVRKAGSIGIPFPNVQVKIVNPETLQEVKPGDIGEVWLKGPNITPGYWNKPRETEAAFVDGWFRTGDLGKEDRDGYYYITDRLKHIIISGGENISPKEVESVINGLGKVLESCVVGVADEKWGEKVVAAVVLKPGADATPKEIQGHCRQHLLDWKCPKEVFFLEELPRNKMGKVLKEAVIKHYQSLLPEPVHKIRTGITPAYRAETRKRRRRSGN